MFNDHFEKVFCLNLPIREDRRERMISLFSKYQIEAEFFSAVRGKCLPHLYSLVSRNFPAIGYFGTLISYLNLFDYALNKGYEKICVLEDDIKIHKDLHSIADFYIPKLPDNTDMAYFSYIPLTETHEDWKYSTINDSFIMGNVFGGIFRPKNICSMMAFSINRKLMEHLMISLNKTFKTIDLHIMETVQGNDSFGVYGINPQMFCASEYFISDGCEHPIEDLTFRSVDIRASKLEDYE